MNDFLNEFARKYGLFIVGGAIGAVIHRLRNKMSFKRFLASVIISTFVAFCVGVVARDIIELKESVVYVLCGISGVFSEIILDEIKEVLSGLGGIIKNKIEKKYD